MKNWILMLAAVCGLVLLALPQAEAARRGCRSCQASQSCADGQCAVAQSEISRELFAATPIVAPRRVVAEQPAGPTVELPKVVWVKVPAYRWRRGIVRYKPVVVKPGGNVGSEETTK